MRKQELLDVPYLSRQLIAYIGNKRRLLPFLDGIFAERERATGKTTFVDPFSGSGAVARLARYRGFRVAAADCEEYAAILCRAALSHNRLQAERLLEAFGGLVAAIDTLNRIGHAAAKPAGAKWAAAKPPGHEHGRVPLSAREVSYGESGVPAPGYVAKHYAPRDTENADYRSERLFYTSENARFIDAVRDTIEEWLPAGRGERSFNDQDASLWGARSLLLAPLLYEASVHANTSGVFKAFHKGFGGHGGDALGRILSAAELEVPSLIEGQPAYVEQADAVDFCGKHSGDIVYLDPPYNQHQYGSNYFMLNTIARWDKPPVNNVRGDDGGLKEKAGIRKDWTETRSDFCYRKSAITAFRRLLDVVDARTLVLSYNTEGIVPFEELYELLSEHGNVQLCTKEYIQFRGGRQSASRRVRTAEIAFVVDRTCSPVSGNHRRNGEHMARALRVAALSASTFVPTRVVERFGSMDAVRSLECDASTEGASAEGASAEEASAEDASAECKLAFESGLRLTTVPTLSELQMTVPEVLIRLEYDLEYCACNDNVEEIEVLLELLDGSFGTSGPSSMSSTGGTRRLEKRAVTLLRKLAHPRYRDTFVRLYQRFVQDSLRAERHKRMLRSLRETSRARLGIDPHSDNDPNRTAPTEQLRRD